MKNIKRPLSLLLLIALVLPLFQLAGMEGLTANAEEKSTLEGKPVYSHYKYHDTWTGGWDGYNGLFDKGTDIASNLNKSFDRGKPLSMQSATIAFKLSTFNVTSLEEFKNKFTVVPLTPQALMNMGLTAEEADTFIGKAISPSIATGGIYSGDVKAFKDKYVSLSVTDYTINNNGITLSGDSVVIPMSYRLSTLTPIDKNPEAPWGMDLRDRVLNPTDGMIVNINKFKAEGRGYEAFREHQMQFFAAPEAAMRSLWDNGVVNPGAVGWRWYMPFTVLQKETLKDLNVKDLTANYDRANDSVECEATIENSFDANLRNVQFVWELETPTGTITQTEVKESLNIVKGAASFTSKHTFTNLPKNFGTGTCRFKINLKEPATERMTFDDGSLAQEIDYTNNLASDTFEQEPLDIKMDGLTATPSKSKDGKFTIVTTYSVDSNTPLNQLTSVIGVPLELVMSIGGKQVTPQVVINADGKGSHTFNVSGIRVPEVGIATYELEAWINHPDITDLEIDKDIADVKSRNNYKVTTISTEGNPPPPVPPTSVCVEGKSVGYDLRYVKRTCQGSSCTYNRRTKKNGDTVYSRTTVYNYKYENIDKSYTHAGRSSRNVQIVQAGVIAPSVRYDGNVPVFRSGYWHSPYVVTVSKVTHEDNKTIVLPGFGANQNIKISTNFNETAGAEGSKPNVTLERVYNREVYKLGGKMTKSPTTISIPNSLIGPVSVNTPSPVGRIHDWKETDIRCTIEGGSRSGNRGTCSPTQIRNEVYEYPQDYVDPAPVRTWVAFGEGSSGSGGSGPEVYYSEGLEYSVYMPPVMASASDMYTTTGNPQSITPYDLNQNKSIIALKAKLDAATAGTNKHKDKLKNEIVDAILKGVKDNRVLHTNYKERDGVYKYNITGACNLSGSTEFKLEGSVFDDIN